MHDCPGCRTPLHGHESFCPVCGAKQYVRPEYQIDTFKQYEKATNPIVFILIALVVGALVFFAVENSWIGQIIKRGPVTEVQDNADTQLAAREKLENAVLQNLANQSSSGKFTYNCDDKIVDRNYPQPVQLTIDANLRYPNRRKEIVDPVKALMVPAHINSLTLNDYRSHATVTYTVSRADASGTGNTQADDNDRR